MSKKTKLLITVLALWAFSSYFADRTDWFLNLTPPAHMTSAIWFGAMSVVLGAVGLFAFIQFLVHTFSDEEVSGKRQSSQQRPTWTHN